MHILARGRVWSGVEAKERGLVDELGGLDTALQTTLDCLKVSARADSGGHRLTLFWQTTREEVDVIPYPPPASLGEVISAMTVGPENRYCP